MHIAFFIALLAMGQMIVESDFGTKVTEFFTFSTYLVAFAMVMFIAGEILERRKKNGRSDM